MRRCVGQLDVLTVVACCYSLTPDTMFSRLQILAGYCGVELRGVIVANRPGVKTFDGEIVAVIQGSNQVNDFSAYIEGLSYLKSRNIDLNCVVFVNDSLFVSHHPSVNLSLLVRQLSLLEKIEEPAMAGKMDRYLTICHRNPWSGLGAYITTYCFALNRNALPILERLGESADEDLGVLDDVAQLSSPSWGKNLPGSFREFVRAFLIYGHPDFLWPGLGHYEADANLLSIKARCIYLEHRLSGEIGKRGSILPTNLRLAQKLRLDLGERTARLMRRFGLEPN